METQILPRIEKSLDGDGWSVRIGSSSWRFNSLHFAQLFSDRMRIDELFSSDILEHSHNHDWERCEPRTCRGRLWQVIQGVQ